MTDQAHNMSYRASNEPSGSRGGQSQERQGLERASRNRNQAHLGQAGQPEIFDSMDRSVRQSGSPAGQVQQTTAGRNLRNGSERGGLGDASRDSSNIRPVLGANQGGEDEVPPGARSPSRRTGASHRSNDDMREEIINTKAWWNVVCYVACVIFFILLLIWLFTAGGIFFKDLIMKSCSA